MNSKYALGRAISTKRRQLCWVAGEKNLKNGTWSSDTETNRCNFMQLAQEILLFLVVPTGGGSK